ncbi:MAG: hypothetical protein KAS96_09330 [Planctomycetes bacterium]|nr:hypothetical protein [Planctomycetota bacterium]
MLDNIFRSKNKSKWLLVIAWWFCGLVLAVFFSLNDNRFPAQSSHYANNFLNDTPAKGHMGAMSYFRRDPAKNGRPLYSVKFDELNTAKGQLGIFKTGIYKIAKVNGLQLKLFQYSSDKKNAPANVSEAEKLVANNNRKDTCSTQFSSKESHSMSSMTTLGDSQGGYSISDLFDELLEKIRNLSRGCQFNSSEESSGSLCNGWKLTPPGIELSDIGEFRVSDFGYQVFYDGELSFGVQGKRMISSYKQPDVILRGHVIITASDGSTLECNYAKWNVKKELFKIDGVYVLNRGGETISGKYICVDTQLNLVEVKHAKSKQKEMKKCFAKLQ